MQIVGGSSAHLDWGQYFPKQSPGGRESRNRTSHEPGDPRRCLSRRPLSQSWLRVEAPGRQQPGQDHPRPIIVAHRNTERLPPIPRVFGFCSVATRCWRSTGSTYCASFRIGRPDFFWSTTQDTACVAEGLPLLASWKRPKRRSALSKMRTVGTSAQNRSVFWDVPSGQQRVCSLLRSTR